MAKDHCFLKSQKLLAEYCIDKMQLFIQFQNDGLYNTHWLLSVAYTEPRMQVIFVIFFYYLCDFTAFFSSFLDTNKLLFLDLNA